MNRSPMDQTELQDRHGDQDDTRVSDVRNMQFDATRSVERLRRLVGERIVMAFERQRRIGETQAVVDGCSKSSKTSDIL